MEACDATITVTWDGTDTSMSCTFNDQTLDSSGSPYGASTNIFYDRNTCCSSHLEGLVGAEPEHVRDACDNTFINYSYTGGICTADRMPVHPVIPDYPVTAIAVGETRPQEECCVAAELPDGISLDMDLLVAC